MGERKPSSKKKSYKKKRLKVSSKIRKRKSRRSKSKKFSSSEDDMSSSASSDYSSSPQSSSSSSSEDDYGRKSRRHSRDVKRVKRRTRRRSSSRDVSEDSPPVKKRKKSNRKSLDHGKKVQKKKRKRYTSISSTSRDSRSCSSCRRENSISSRGRDCKSFSTCQDETNSGNEDIHLQIPRIKSRKMKEKKIRNEPSVDIRSGSTEPICSLCNHHSCSCNTTRSGKECAEESNPKRLRSVITISEKTSEEEGDKQGPDMLKEETMNKHHDCPSCRNHDNNDLENKSKPCSCFLSNQTLQIGNLITDDAFPPNSETFGPTKVGGSMDPHSNEVKEVSHDNGGESGKSDNVANTAVEDLETVLRKKALENLQKFRKERINLKSGAKEKKNDSVVNQLSSSKTEVVPYKFPEQEKEEGFALNQVLERRSKLVITEEFSHSAKIGKKNSPVEENNRKGSGCVEQGVTQPSDRSALSQSPEKVDHTTGPVLINQPEPGKPLSSTTVQTYKKENPLASKRNIIKTPVPPLRPGVLSTGTSDNLDTGAVNTSIRPTVESTSSVRSTSDGLTSKHQPDETKDASQFEQKTMSVMRGGEMVQVNYKVYIPQRASALARKPLKR